MDSESNAARRYRLYAEELRTMADDDGHRRTREMLLEVARDYELMAQSCGAIAESRRRMLGG